MYLSIGILAVLGLGYCEGISLLVSGGFALRWLLLLQSVGSRARRTCRLSSCGSRAQNQCLRCRGLIALQYVGSS